MVSTAGGEAFRSLGALTDVQGGLDRGLRVIAYGMIGGVTSVMGGGKFQSGFLAAGFSALAGPAIDKLADGNIVLGTAASGVDGGVGSVLGGGKFENRAVTGAFAYVAGRVLTQRPQTSSERRCLVAGPGVCSSADKQGLRRQESLRQGNATTLVNEVGVGDQIVTTARNGDSFTIQAQGSTWFSDGDLGRGMVSPFGDGIVKIEAWSSGMAYQMRIAPDIQVYRGSYSIAASPKWGSTYIRIEGLGSRSIVMFIFIDAPATLTDTRIRLYRE